MHSDVIILILTLWFTNDHKIISAIIVLGSVDAHKITLSDKPCSKIYKVADLLNVYPNEVQWFDMFPITYHFITRCKPYLLDSFQGDMPFFCCWYKMQLVNAILNEHFSLLWAIDLLLCFENWRYVKCLTTWARVNVILREIRLLRHSERKLDFIQLGITFVLIDWLHFHQISLRAKTSLVKRFKRSRWYVSQFYYY